jgi:hypothetical protein
MESNEYVEGAPVRVRVAVDLNDVPTDVAATCKVRTPDNRLLTPAVTHDSLGNYSAVVLGADTLGFPGTYDYRFDGTGAAAGAGEGAFIVNPTRVL